MSRSVVDVRRLAFFCLIPTSPKRYNLYLTPPKLKGVEMGYFKCYLADIE